MDRKKLALGVSAVLNAPLITLATFIPLILVQETGQAFTLIAITTLFGSVLPLVMVWGLLRLRVIKDFYANERSTRTIPFLWSMIFYLLGVCALIVVNAPTVVTALMACYFVNGFVLLLITSKWKISIHASGITSPVTALVYLLGNWMLPLFLMVIPVAWARMELKAHDLKQIAAGAVLSTMLTWIQMSFYVHHMF
ncbi:hypothetical protein MUO93_05005 [Candidatus Bathyarchaeota archaeon]|nr:hypothetical protein [Candidatus Bathyarchaeota archaeon]